MKVNEIRFADYEYERVRVLTAHFAENYPPKTEDAVLRNHGEEELAENGGVTTDGGWLVLRLASAPDPEEAEEAPKA